MTQNRDLEHTLSARLDALAAFAKTVALGSHETICPKGRVALEDKQPQLTPDERIALHGTLAEGGMAVVRLGTQRALGRRVAVKVLREGSNEDAKVELLREAWLTGHLEHPNIVPVHDIEVDQRGDPMIVLKHIEGVAWSEVMADADAVRERFGEGDLLAWNLAILMQLCNAVHYAHSRRIVHRDLKPQNVMIGRFGEVYLLDWGIAVSLEDDGSGRFPLASEAVELAGTPAYMAPEMLGGGDLPLSERTDVYLLGAILFEVICGRPPHVGHDLHEVLRSVIRAVLELPSKGPAELRAICRRALSLDPADRFPDAESLRSTLRDFLRHRGSTLLAQEAQGRLEELKAMLAESERAPAERARIYNLYSECRFGFRQALRSWPDNGDAHRGLRCAADRMVAHEMGRGDPARAETIVTELPELADELADQLAELRDARKRTAKDDEMARSVARHFDASTGASARTLLYALYAAVNGGWIWLEWGILGPVMVFGSLRALLIAVSISFTALAGGMWLAGHGLLRTTINRILVASLALNVLAQLLWVLGAMLLNVEPLVVQISLMIFWTLAAATLATVVNHRLNPAALGYLASFFGAILWPEQRGWFMGAGHVVNCINTLLIRRSVTTEREQAAVEDRERDAKAGPR